MPRREEYSPPLRVSGEVFDDLPPELHAVLDRAVRPRGEPYNQSPLRGLIEREPHGPEGASYPKPRSVVHEQPD